MHSVCFVVPRAVRCELTRTGAAVTAGAQVAGDDTIYGRCAVSERCAAAGRRCGGRRRPTLSELAPRCRPPQRTTRRASRHGATCHGATAHRAVAYPFVAPTRHGAVICRAATGRAATNPDQGHPARASTPLGQHPRGRRGGRRRLPLRRRSQACGWVLRWAGVGALGAGASARRCGRALGPGALRVVWASPVCGRAGVCVSTAAVVHWAGGHCGEWDTAVVWRWACGAAGRRWACGCAWRQVAGRVPRRRGGRWACYK